MVTELDPDCFELLKIVHHAINDPITFWNYGHDMTKRRHVADVDLYLGTSPCQDFSNAGQGRGLHWPCLLKVYLWFYPSEFACRNQRCKRQTVVRADREDPARASSGRELISGFDSKFASNKSASKAFMLENVKGLLTPPYALDESLVLFSQAGYVLSLRFVPEKDLNWTCCHSSYRGHQVRAGGDFSPWPATGA